MPTKGGGEYSYRYADLPDVLAAVQPVLTKHGLAVVGLPDTTPEGEPALTTRLLHASGGFAPEPPNRADFRCNGRSRTRSHTHLLPE